MQKSNIRKLSTKDPYDSLCGDLYSIGLFDIDINGLLSIIEKNDEVNTILIERKFKNTTGNHLNSGYCFVQCLNSFCEEENLREFRRLLEDIVIQKAKANYMEVDAILIAPGFNDVVFSFVEQYNQMQKRKPIQLFTY